MKLTKHEKKAIKYMTDKLQLYYDTQDKLLLSECIGYIDALLDLNLITQYQYTPLHHFILSQFEIADQLTESEDTTICLNTHKDEH